MTGRRIHIAMVAVCAALFSWFAYRPSALSQLLSLAACPAAVVILAGLSLAYRRFGRREIATLVALVLSPLIGRAVGHAIRRVDFELRVRPRYEHFVSRLERETTADERTARLWPVPGELDGVAESVLVRRDASGAFCVVFLWGGGFPVRHSVFVHAPPGACATERGTYGLVPYDDEWLAGHR